MHATKTNLANGTFRVDASQITPLTPHPEDARALQGVTIVIDPEVFAAWQEKVRGPLRFLRALFTRVPKPTPMTADKWDQITSGVVCANAFMYEGRPHVLLEAEDEDGLAVAREALKKTLPSHWEVHPALYAQGPVLAAAMEARVQVLAV